MCKLHLFINPTRRAATACGSLLLLLLLVSMATGRHCLVADDAADASVVDTHNNNISAIFSPATNCDERPEAVAAASAAPGRQLRRGKRYLDFTRGTRVSWRTNIKNNLIKVNTLWAHAFGFRFNYPFPDKADRLRPFFKRDVLHALEDSLSAHDFDGRACVLKSYCSALYEADSPLGGGMLFKLLKVLFSLDKEEQRHLPYLRPDNCQQILHTHCPLSFNSISPFTDD